ncbi:peptidoglycan-binding domain-containing protein [Demequina capsici]|uniref:Peptidoglycan-binding domain-containing protein n=1 Tax=Demequina capsici TaxID=3075620 RepID=A0AA96F6E6_9MICO|nr:peptidoglycan-binding domain-containing protein [Demequina sp. OYTSA14]WNM24693.1 peptidoglycan-binding domain-containing protein [Demequina sp. OYTSA14]
MSGDERGERAPHSWRLVARATLVVVLIGALAGAGVLVYIAASRSPLESAAAPEPLVAKVESVERYDEAQVGISLTYATPTVATAQATGTITSLNVAPGSDVHAGDVIMTVDAGDVIAYASDRPLYRDITEGDSGDDVTAAQQLLVTLGYLDADPDGKAGRATRTAIIAFNAAHGYGQKNPILSRASLVWLDASASTVATVDVSVAQEIAPGTTLWEAADAPLSVKVAETSVIPQDGDWEIDAYGVTAAYAAGSGTVADPAAVASIAAAMGAVTDGVATVRRAEPLVVGAVPSSAVVSDDEGRTCIFPSVDGAPVVVQPTGGGLGTVQLDPSLVGQDVLVNPREARKDLTCG